LDGDGSRVSNLVVGEVDVENILISSEGVSKTSSTSVTDLIACEVEVSDGGIGVDKLDQFFDGRVIEVVLVEVDLRESVVAARESLSESSSTSSSDLVLVEVEGSNCRLASDGRGKSSNSRVVNLILRKIDLSERSALGDALGEVLGTRASDLVLAKVERLDAELLENLGDVLEGGVGKAGVGKGKAFSLVMSGQCLGQGNGAFFGDGSVLQVEVWHGLANEERNDASVGSRTSSITRLEVVDVGNLGGQEEVPRVAFLLCGSSDEKLTVADGDLKGPLLLGTIVFLDSLLTDNFATLGQIDKTFASFSSLVFVVEEGLPSETEPSLLPVLATLHGQLASFDLNVF